MDLKAQLRAQLLFRTAFLVMMMGSSEILRIFYQEGPAPQVVSFCTLGLGFTLLSGLLYWLSPLRWLPVLIWSQVFWDLGTATYLLHSVEVVTAVSIVLFIIHIVFATVVIGPSGAIVSSILSAALFSYLSVGSIGLHDALSVSSFPKLLFVLSSILFLGGCLAYIARHRERMRVHLDQTSNALRDLSSLHAAIINHSPAGILSIDREARVTVMNRMAEIILGRNLIGQTISTGPFAELFKTADRCESRLEIRGDLRFVGHQRVELPEGQGWLVIFQDVTEMREMESRMKVNDKLASVGQLAAGIAHEIRNPLASLSGSIQMLKSEMPHEGTSEKLMQIVLRETDRLDNLLGNFLMYAKPSEIRTERVDVKKRCSEIVELIKNRFGQRVHCAVQIEDELDCVCDPTQISQILWNLILNAIQASSEGAEVRVRAFTRELMEGPRVRFEVSDSGLGIPLKLREKIFDPFFTTKPEGTGLGLPLVFQMVKAHGGSMGVETEEGKGSIFWFELFRDGPRIDERRVTSSAA